MSDRKDQIVPPLVTFLGKVFLGIVAIVAVVIAGYQVLASSDYRQGAAPTEQREIQGADEGEESVSRLMAISRREEGGQAMGRPLVNLQLVVRNDIGKAEFRPKGPDRKPNLSFDTRSCPNSLGTPAKFYLFLYSEELSDNFAPSNGQIILNGLFELRDVQQRADKSGKPFCFIDAFEK